MSEIILSNIIDKYNQFIKLCNQLNTILRNEENSNIDEQYDYNIIVNIISCYIKEINKLARRFINDKFYTNELITDSDNSIELLNNLLDIIIDINEMVYEYYEYKNKAVTLRFNLELRKAIKRVNKKKIIIALSEEFVL